MKFFRLFVSFCALTVVGGCAYIIPPEQNSPRNNIVVGAPHRPELNNSSMSGNGEPHSALVPHSGVPHEVAYNAPSVTLPAPVPEQAMTAPMLPPVDAATQAQAEQEMARQASPVMAGAPMVTPVTQGRHVPIENAPFEISANDDYPPLTNVPERPIMAGPDSTREYLTAVHGDLVHERDNSANAAAALARDAAAEPSMLAPMPQTNAAQMNAPRMSAVVPTVDQIVSQPIMPAPDASVTIPHREDVRTVPAEQPGASAAPVPLRPLPQQTADIRFNAAPAPNFAPPPTMNAVTPVPSTNAIVTPAPSMNAVMPAPLMNVVATPAPVVYSPAPIVLTRPVDNEPVFVTQNLPPVMAPAPTMTASTARPTVRHGDFDPLAAADNAPIASAASTTMSANAPTTYASDGYLAASRYAGRRY